MTQEQFEKGGKLYSLLAMAKKKDVKVSTLRRKVFMAGIKPNPNTGFILINDSEFDELWKVPASSLEELEHRK